MLSKVRCPRRKAGDSRCALRPEKSQVQASLPLKWCALPSSQEFAEQEKKSTRNQEVSTSREATSCY